MGPQKGPQLSATGEATGESPEEPGGKFAQGSPDEPLGEFAEGSRESDEGSRALTGGSPEAASALTRETPESADASPEAASPRVRLTAEAATKSPNVQAVEFEVEYGISEVAKLAGTTSRTLRHYDDVGLLAPTRLGPNGYRYYDAAALTRLQRILMLRQFGLGVATIGEVLGASDDTTALHAHLHWLRAESQRLDRQIASVERTIDSIEKGEPIMAKDMFDGFDHTQYKQEVEARWGAKAYADSDRWWRGLGAEGHGAFKAESTAIIEAWRDLHTRGVAVDAPEAMSLARRHHAWIAQGWGGVGIGDVPAEALTGLGDMYVADERFAANYGGVEGATYVRDVLSHYAITELL